MKADNDNIRYYPPAWCSAGTMAYLLDLGESTFRAYVTRGLLPAGVHRGGSVRWHREGTLDAWGRAPKSKPTPKAANDNEEDLSQQIIASIKRHGQTKKARG